MFVYPCRFLRVVTTVVIVVYVFIEVVLEHPENLISVLGLIVTILVFFVTSKAPEKVNGLVKTNGGKKDDKNQESIQLSATPDTGYHMGK